MPAGNSPCPSPRRRAGTTSRFPSPGSVGSPCPFQFALDWEAVSISMNLNPTLNSDESTENEGHREALFDRVASRNAILFVGAGSSQRCGYPGWGALARQLGEIVDLAPP